MDTQADNPEDIDRQLADARKALQDFEDGADFKRLLLRLRTSSPAHPVLLARFLFGGLAVLAVIGAVGVMVMTQLDHDLARVLARFDRVIPLPEEIPALPTLLFGVSLMMVVAWGMATMAAMQLGRDATMLPWEQKQHQKLVNEVTRLTTQKAVMERIRSTPAGARPRIATPVPVSARTRANNTMSSRSPPADSNAPPPSYLASEEPAQSGRSFGGGRGGASSGGFGGGSSGGFGGAGGPSYGAPTGGLGGAAPAYGSPAGGAVGGFGRPARPTTPPPEPVSAPPPVASPATRPSGLLGRASQSRAPEGPTNRTPLGVSRTGGAGGFAPVSQAMEPSGYTAPGPTPPSGYASIPTAAARVGTARPAAAPPVDVVPEAELIEEVDRTRGRIAAAAPAEDVAALVEPDPVPDDPISDYGEPVVGGVAGGVRLGSRPPSKPADDFSDLVEVEGGPAPRSATPPTSPDREAGILGRARAGATGLRSTPYGSAGRIRPPPVSTAKPAAPEPQAPSAISGAGPSSAPRVPVGRVATATPPVAEPARPSEVATRGGTPLGSAPRVGASVRTRAASSPPGAPDRGGLPGGMFGTPQPVARSSAPPVSTPARPAPKVADDDRTDEVVVMEEEEDLPTVQSPRPAPTEPARPARANPTLQPPGLRALPQFKPVQEEWLTDALARAETLLKGFPVQAYLEFSQEPHLPFTLVIARATPAMAVRAMVNFVEFLAGISTPPRARIELVNIPHLDRSFHKNVEAALEPYFGGNVEVEPNPGRVDILFTDPDPQWGNWPVLPLEQGPES